MTSPTAVLSPLPRGWTQLWLKPLSSLLTASVCVCLLGPLLHYSPKGQQLPVKGSMHRGRRGCSNIWS